VPVGGALTRGAVRRRRRREGRRARGGAAAGSEADGLTPEGPVINTEYGDAGDAPPVEQDPAGKVVKSPEREWIFWHANGNREQQGRFKHGERDGLWTFWYPASNKMLEGSFLAGQEHGRWMGWYARGPKKFEGEFADGVEVGAWKTWSEGGSLQTEGAYDKGKKTGRWVYYHPGGKVREEGDFVAGEETACGPRSTPPARNAAKAATSTGHRYLDVMARGRPGVAQRRVRRRQREALSAASRGTCRVSTHPRECAQRPREMWRPRATGPPASACRTVCRPSPGPSQRCRTAAIVSARAYPIAIDAGREPPRPPPGGDAATGTLAIACEHQRGSTRRRAASTAEASCPSGASREASVLACARM
jgi:hypothetical protein